MIVHCPSCSTRYRHAAMPESLPASAHCSECDEVFPLETPRRPYLLVSATNGPARRTFGMDDPGLAPQVGRRTPDHAPSAVLSYTALDPGDERGRGVVVPIPGDRLVAPPEASIPAGPIVVSEPWTPTAEFLAAARTEPATEEPPARARGRSVLSETLVVVAPAAAGVGLAYYFGGGMAGSPGASVALGGVLGLLVGWGCLRWMRPED